MKFENDNGIIVFPVNSEETECIRALLVPNVYEEWKAGRDMLVLAAVKDRIAVGALAAAMEDGDLAILSLYMAPEYRKQGGGSLLLDACIMIAEQEADAVTADFVVTSPEEEEMERLLVGRAFWEEVPAGAIYETELRKLSENPVLQKKGNDSGVPLSKLGPVEKKKAEQMLAEKNVPWEYGMFTEKSLEQDISRILFRDQEPVGFFLCDYNAGGVLSVTGAWNGSGVAVKFISMLTGAVAEAAKKYPPETKVTMQAVNGTTEKLILTLLPGAERISRFYVRVV